MEDAGVFKVLDSIKTSDDSTLFPRNGSFSLIIHKLIKENFYCSSKSSQSIGDSLFNQSSSFEIKFDSFSFCDKPLKYYVFIRSYDDVNPVRIFVFRNLLNKE